MPNRIPLGYDISGNTGQFAPFGTAGLIHSSELVNLAAKQEAAKPIPVGA